MTERKPTPHRGLEAAKIFYAKGAYLNSTSYNALFTNNAKAGLSTETVAKKHVFYKLRPLWKDAFEVKAQDGAELIVVPTLENKLNGKTFEIRRFFIFTKKGGSIVDGRIVEFLGLQYALKDKIDGIIANYRSSSVSDLTGAIFEYDLNYFRLSAEVITQGKRTGVTASLHNLPVAITNVSGKAAMGYYDTGTPNGSGCSKLWYYEGQSNGITCWNQGYTGTCEPDPTQPTGSDSGYDSSGAYQSGGGPYAGNPSAQGNNPITALMNNPNSLTNSQKTQLQTILNNILKDCIGRSTYNYLTSNGHKFDFLISSGAQPPASYNPSNQSITIKDPSSLDATSLQEEFFHAYQNYTMPGGTTQYLGKSGSANIEFEAKVLRDMSTMVNGQGGILAITGDNYRNFLIDVTNGFSAFPSSFTPSQLTQYFNYMNDFIQPSQNPGYSNDIIKGDLNPTSMFNLINNSPC